MNKIQIEYKKDTGKNYFTDIEELHCSESMDTRVISDMTAKEIISLLDYDNKFWAIKSTDLEDISLLNNEACELRFYSKEYVEYLENIINELL